MIFSFGGIKGEGMGEVSGELKTMNLKSTVINSDSWLSRDFTSSSPGCRASHAMCSDGEFIYLIGGIDANRQVRPQMDVLNCRTMIWTNLTFRDPVAAKALTLYGQSLVYFEGSLYSFGGCNELGNYWNETLKFSVQNNQWSFLRVKGSRPSPRNRSASFVVPSVDGKHNLYIVGGGSYLPKEERIDVFTLNLKTLTWSIIRTNGHIPLSRFAFGSSYDVHSRKFFIFGGHTRWYHRLGDLQCLDIDSRHWTHIRTEYGPCPRAFHSCFLYEQRMYIFGGTDGEKRINDMWIFDLTAICENEVPATIMAPASL